MSGKLEAEDYRDASQPALEQAVADGEVRIVIVIPAFEGFSAEALWQDPRLGVEHWRAWNRIALVTDIEWMTRGTEWFSWMTPGELTHLPLAERDAAIAWAAG